MPVVRQEPGYHLLDSVRDSVVCYISKYEETEHLLTGMHLRGIQLLHHMWKTCLPERNYLIAACT